METHPREGVVKEEKFTNTRKPFHQQVCGGLWNLRGKGIINKQTNNPQIMRLTITPSGEVVQKLTFASSEWGLKREGGVDCIT